MAGVAVFFALLVESLSRSCCGCSRVLVGFELANPRTRVAVLVIDAFGIEESAPTKVDVVVHDSCISRKTKASRCQWPLLFLSYGS